MNINRFKRKVSKTKKHVKIGTIRNVYAFDLKIFSLNKQIRLFFGPDEVADFLLLAPWGIIFCLLYFRSLYLF